jgi:diguanylate cyclase (GGDEF)-like protein/PAS domain S-box-containing protein
LIHADNEQSFLDAICRLAVKTGGYLMAWIGFANDDAVRSISCRAHCGDDDGYLNAVHITWSDAEHGCGPAGTSIKTGRTVVNQNFDTNPAMVLWHTEALRRGYRANIALPIVDKQQHVIGVFCAYAADPFSFNPAEVAMLEDLGKNLAYGIETLRTRKENDLAKIALQAEHERSITLLRNASDGIHILDRTGILIEASDSFCTMLGYAPRELIGRHVAAWDARHDPAMLERFIQQQIDGGVRTQFETTHRCKDGALLEVEVSGYCVALDGRQVLFNSSRDITARKQAELHLQAKQQQLIESETQYSDLMKNLQVAIVVHAPDTRIVFSNSRASELLHLTEDQLRGRAAFDPAWCFIDEDEKPMVPEQYPVNRVIASRQRIDMLVLGVQTAEAPDVTWLLVNAFPEMDPNGELKQVIVNFDDITARKLAEQKIHHLAYFDALTRLPNRRLLMERFQTTFTTTPHRECYGAVLYIDIDKFKVINDVLGHDLGDLVLVTAAQRIERLLGDRDTIARVGGDEFVVLLVDAGIDRENASQATGAMVERIRLALIEPYELRGHRHHSSASIGAAVFAWGEGSPDGMMRQADIAMYKAKDMGRNAWCFFNPAMQLEVETHATLETDLRRAVGDNQLRLFYQVQVDNDLRVIGAEALVRWMHPQRGMVSPMQFIPIAEESSLIIEIGNWVLQTACQQLAAWKGDESTSRLSLAVNVSARQFRQVDFVPSLAAMLRKHDVPAALLKLELTESVVLNDVSDVTDKMYALKGLGVTLSMDDFGTGYSSLSYLKQLPLDQIKIDQSFVRDITTDPNDAVMVKTIIDLAKNFRLNVIAEGVETDSQFRFLKEHGCLLYQGYLFSRPVPIDECEKLLVAMGR